MLNSDRLVFETDTKFDHFQIWDMVYEGRPARVLYNDNGQAAQSGIARDNKPDLLFDYNQRFFELVCGTMPKKLLLIGGGMFTLPTALMKALPNLKIDVVEIDEELTHIAQEYFNLVITDNLHIYNKDGLAYLQNNPTRYDLILIDVFIKLKIPESFMTADAIASYASHLTKHGVIAQNVVSSYLGKTSSAIFVLVERYDTQFQEVSIYPASHAYSLWLPQNLILTATNNQFLNLDDLLRYAALKKSEDL
jgi:spermidine synthase